MDEIEKLAGLSLWENNLDEISMKGISRKGFTSIKYKY